MRILHKPCSLMKLNNEKKKKNTQTTPCKITTLAITVVIAPYLLLYVRFETDNLIYRFKVLVCITYLKHYFFVNFIIKLCKTVTGKFKNARMYCRHGRQRSLKLALTIVKHHG